MTVQLINADCVEAMAGMEPESIDSIVCDPPYSLGFMGMAWDTLDGRSTGTQRRSSENDFDHTGGNHNPINSADAARMRRVENNRSQAWHQQWAEQAFRVLKPGGYLIAAGAPRTYHRLACAIEDAGFELRDCVMHCFGSGFPKGLDVSKAIDRVLGAEREVVGINDDYLRRKPNGMKTPGSGTYNYSQTQYETDARITAPASSEAEQWQGWNVALKPAYEPWTVARKPLIGSVASNVLKYGTGGLNIDATRVGVGTGGDREGEATATKRYTDIGSTNFAATPGPRGGDALGRWPANLVLSHVGGPDGCVKVGQSTEPGYQINRFTDGAKPFGNGAGHPYESEQQASQPVDVFECVSGCPVRVLDEQAGSSISRTGSPRSGNNGTGWGMEHTGAEYDDAGGPSRYFNTFEPDFDPPFYYTAKASTAEREAGLSELEVKPFAQGTGAQNAIKNGAEYQGEYEGGDTGPTAYNRIKRRANCHPTVKPLQLMRHLVRLVTPPRGTVLDPFMGSGSTGVAAIFEGMNFIGIEKDTEHGYMDIARARIAYAEKRVALGYTTFEDVVNQTRSMSNTDAKPVQVTTQIDMFEGLL